MHALFELGGDDPIAPDVRGGCVWLLARINVKKGSGVTRLDYFACKDGVGQARMAAISLHMLGNTGCIEKNGVTTGAVERLRNAMHLHEIYQPGCPSCEISSGGRGTKSNLLAMSLQSPDALEFFEAIDADDMQRTLDQMNLQVGMGLEIPITFRTILMTLGVLDFMIPKLLLAGKANIAGHAFVNFDLDLSCCDGPAGRAYGSVGIVGSLHRYRRCLVIGVFRVVGFIASSMTD